MGRDVYEPAGWALLGWDRRWLGGVARGPGDWDVNGGIVCVQQPLTLSSAACPYQALGVPLHSRLTTACFSAAVRGAAVVLLSETPCSLSPD